MSDTPGQTLSHPDFLYIPGPERQDGTITAPIATTATTANTEIINSTIIALLLAAAGIINGQQATVFGYCSPNLLLPSTPQSPHREEPLSNRYIIGAGCPTCPAPRHSVIHPEIAQRGNLPEAIDAKTWLLAFAGDRPRRPSGGKGCS
jgi:hypothetical protein